MAIRLPRSAAPVSADDVTLEDAELAADQADHPHVSVDELSADVVDTAH